MSHEDYKLLPLATVGAVKGLVEVFIETPLKEARPSTKAWLGGVAIATAYELACPKGETLSEGYDSFLEKHPAITWGVTAVTVAHLLNVIPDRLQKYDPFHVAHEFLRGE